MDLLNSKYLVGITCFHQPIDCQSRHPLVSAVPGLPAHAMQWLDKIPLSTLLIITIALGLAPFMPEPHLWEKLKMLFSGTLSRPIDIFDLFMHGTPVALLVM